MSDHVKLAIAAVLVAVLAAWGIHGGGFAGGTARLAQEKLQIRADQQIAAMGARDWARVQVRGQRADLTGVAPSEEELAVVRGALRSAVWNGGWLLGGVTGVRSDGAQVWVQRDGAYPWRADLDLNRLQLTGAAPSAAVAQELETFARTLFVDHRVVNDLDIDPLPPGEGWAEAARGGLVVLSRLEVGVAELADFTLDVTGVAATPEDADAAYASLDQLTGVISAVSQADIRARRPAPPIETEPPAEPTGAAEAGAPAIPVPAEAAASAPEDDQPVEAASAEETSAGADCQARLDEVLSESEIHFDIDSADLSAESLPLLDQVAAVAAACPPLVLRVEGHTDDTGDDSLNQTLSERRAQAVADRLTVLGVEPARLRAVGLGASRPAAENATPTGRRENRRIEIIVEP